MTIIGTDKNGDEIAEVSVSELDDMFKEIRNKAIDDFFKKIMKYCSMSNMNATMIRQIAEQLKEGSADNE